MKCGNVAKLSGNYITFQPSVNFNFELNYIIKYMQTTEIEKSKVHNLAESIDYVANSVVSRTIVRKTTGNIKLVAIDAGEMLTESISPFDTFVQVIEGVAEFNIDNKPYTLQKDQGIIIPAHSAYVVKASRKYKLISTVIKSGYEGIIL